MSDDRNGELQLSGGRKLVVGGDDRLEIRSDGGELELSITITEAGPVVKLKAARLELESSEDIAVSCRDFRLDTRGDIKLRSDGQTHVDGDWVNINCQERRGTGWHDDPALPESARRELEAAAETLETDSSEEI